MTVRELREALNRVLDADTKLNDDSVIVLETLVSKAASDNAFSKFPNTDPHCFSDFALSLRGDADFISPFETEDGIVLLPPVIVLSTDPTARRPGQINQCGRVPNYRTN